MLQAVGRAGQVIAFEPQPALSGYLGEIKATLGADNLVVEGQGLSSRPGSLRLVIPALGRSQSPLASFEAEALPGYVSYEVPVATLDGYCEQAPLQGRLSFIKCGVEGHEAQVLQGAVQTLRRHRPAVLLECETRHLRGRGIWEVFRVMRELGYEGHFFWGRRRLPVSAFSPAVHQACGKKPYADTFLFLPSA